MLAKSSPSTCGNGCHASAPIATSMTLNPFGEDVIFVILLNVYLTSAQKVQRIRLQRGFLGFSSGDDFSRWEVADRHLGYILINSRLTRHFPTVQLTMIS